MKRNLSLPCLFTTLCLLTTLSAVATELKVADNYGKLPLSFEANQGQSDAQVKFLSRGSGYTLFLTPNEAVLLLQKGAQSAGVRQHGKAGINELVSPQNFNREDDARTKSAMLRIALVGANPAPQLTGLDDLPGKANYFIGNDPKKWRTDVPMYAKVKYRAVYPGVDLVYYGNERQLEHDFIVAPGADPAAITLRLEGAEKLLLNAQGDLVLTTQNGEVRFQKPVIYQEVDGIRQEIAGGYRLKGKDRVGFEVAAYDTTRPLVVDPTLAYSTYLAGNADQNGNSIAVDSAGNAYVTGWTTGSFPTTSGAYQTTYGGATDVFIAKLSADGSSLVYSTYLGGNLNDTGFGIAVDASGNAYVTGRTYSANFPITPGAFQTSLSDFVDNFVTKLNPSGSGLVYSTYLGDSSSDNTRISVAVDALGNAYVAGHTPSSSFPTTAGAFQTMFGGVEDAFVSKLNPSGSALVYSTYLGGNDFDGATGIAVDSVGSAYLAGNARSSNFPTTAGAFQTSGGGPDTFVTKLSADGSSLIYSTYLGGGGYTVAAGGIAVDSSGNAYLTGYIDGSFPTTSGAYQTTYGGGGGDAYITKLNAAGSSLVYSTYLGGSLYDYPLGIAIDSSGNAYVTGYTQGSFPTTSGAPQTTFGGNYDAFVAELSANGSSLGYSTYLGGSGYEQGNSIAVDSAGSAYVTGWTTGNFPTTSGAYQTTFGVGGSYDAFVTKIGPALMYKANVQQPINSDNSSVFNASRGVVPVKFTLTLNGVTTCNLPPATISLARTAGGTIGPIDESVYQASADTGSSFRIDGCQYIYNLGSKSLGGGTYLVEININGAPVGNASFGLQ